MGGGSVVIPLHHRHQRWPTHHPPPEQLLRGLEAGGVLLGSLGVVGRCWHCWHHRRPPFPFPPRLPPRLPFPSLFHRPTTPRAVAHEAGGVWCAIVMWQHGGVVVVVCASLQAHKSLENKKKQC